MGNVGEASTEALASLFTRGLTLGRSLINALSVGFNTSSTPVPSLALTSESIPGRAYTSVHSVGKASTTVSTSVPTRKVMLGKSLTSAQCEKRLRMLPHLPSGGTHKRDTSQEGRDVLSV